MAAGMPGRVLLLSVAVEYRLMALKKGNGLPKRGNPLPLLSADTSYEQVISAALRRELGTTRYTAKTLMRWTGAVARTAKHWLAGSAGPSGVHLIALMRNSDAVLEAVLELAGRRDCIAPEKTSDSGERLAELRALLESAIALTSDSPNASP
jgi:hypothetical protein